MLTGRAALVAAPAAGARSAPPAAATGAALRARRAASRRTGDLTPIRITCRRRQGKTLRAGLGIRHSGLALGCAETRRPRNRNGPPQDAREHGLVKRTFTHS